MASNLETTVDGKNWLSSPQAHIFPNHLKALEGGELGARFLKEGFKFGRLFSVF